ncbi:uncharacterized protein CXQ87_001217 [Candidozyma duobushaemuli]|uniref:Triacylglycerol lipase n=2 Tax=Candidozyma TaxID=3303203 RepID=A0ABX8I6M8_9ASCO|nr:uncharacterized protein CXQ87_001217 [[Candida] duobushaemulonis]PVH18297.1 hypothetical protein CXQ87_001217 [[Candida] duobushaemulonis]QWU86848.1 hypothetical protein CA3LBN_001066 [[Candida] haemuloni]
MLLLSFVLWAVAAAQFIVPTPPTKDDFYVAPKNLSDYRNGDIIASRPAPAMIRSIYFPMNVKNAWQLSVRSENSHGDPTQVVTTILEPYDADPKKLLSYQPAQDSSSNNCSPSYSMLFNAPMDTIVVQAEMVLMETALAKGWFLVVPDYEGIQGAFTAGKQSGQATLDSLRAALNSEDISGIDPKAKAAFWGYSGGTIASGWAAALQPDYAPELKPNLIGCALGGWVTNITLTAEATDGTIFGGLIPNAINGLLNEYPTLSHLVDTEIQKSKQERFLAANEKCLVTSIIQYMFVKFFSGKNPWATRGWGFFELDIVQEVVRNNSAAISEDGPIPEIPVFVFHGTEDEIVPFSGAQRGYDNYCDWGIDSLEFAVSNTTGHILEVVEGSGAALVWLEKMFNGGKPVDGCKRTVRTTNIEYPGADVQYRQLVRTLFSSIAGGDVGETTRNITESTMVSKIMTSAFSSLIEHIGPVALKRENGAEMPELRGLNDVMRLWEREGEDPIAELARR